MSYEATSYSPYSVTVSAWMQVGGTIIQPIFPSLLSIGHSKWRGENLSFSVKLRIHELDSGLSLSRNALAGCKFEIIDISLRQGRRQLVDGG